MTAWMPIETAPKDKLILLFLGDIPGRSDILQYTVGRWCTDAYSKKPRPYWSSQAEAIHGVNWMRMRQPTHWQPLPAPPSP